MRSATLAVCSLAVLCVLAGCGGSSGPPPAHTPPVNATVAGPTTTNTGTPTPFPPGVAETAHDRALLEYFRGRTLPLHSIETENGSVHVRYGLLNGTQPREQAVLFLGLSYGSVVDETWRNATTWNASRMDGVAVAQNGTAVSRFRMPASWGEQTATGELSATELAARLRNATESLDATATDDHLQSFRAVARNGSNATVSSVDSRGRTVFVTVVTETDNSTLDSVLGQLRNAYGRSVANGWNTTALEVTIRRPSGDLYGWYRADAAEAAAVATGNASASSGIVDSVYLERDRLEPSR